jgi:hypothetical protein
MYIVTSKPKRISVYSGLLHMVFSAVLEFATLQARKGLLPWQYRPLASSRIRLPEGWVPDANHGSPVCRREVSGNDAITTHEKISNVVS